MTLIRFIDGYTSLNVLRHTRSYNTCIIRGSFHWMYQSIFTRWEESTVRMNLDNEHVQRFQCLCWTWSSPGIQNTFSVQDFNNIQPQDHKFAALGTTGSIGADTSFKIEYTLGTTGSIGADTGFTIEYTLGATGRIGADAGFTIEYTLGTTYFENWSWYRFYNWIYSRALGTTGSIKKRHWPRSFMLR